MKLEMIKCSSNLKPLIYNPELPQELPTDHENFYMFHKLFLLLSPDFWDIFGEELETWFEIFADLMQMRDSDHEWLKKDRWLSPWPTKCLKCTGGVLGECKMKYTPVEFYDLLQRRPNGGPLNWIFQISEINEHYFHRKRISSSVFDDIYRGVSPTYLHDTDLDPADVLMGIEDDMGTEFEAFMGNLREGKINQIILPAIDLSYPVDRIMQDFKAYIDDRQTKFFEQNPRARLAVLGNRPRKKDGRSISYPYDKWSLYYKAFVLKRQRGLTYEQIGEILIPDNYNFEVNISYHINEAERMINAAWEGTFPDQKRKLY